VRSTSYESIADEYEESRGGQARADLIAAAIDRHLAAQSLVLDVGVGTGIIAATLERHGHRVVGVDIAPGMLRHSASRLPGRVGLADGLALPVAGASVDGVVFVWVLHHVADPVAALAEARRALRASGCVLALAARPVEGDNDIKEAFSPLLALHLGRMDEVQDLTPFADQVGVAVVTTEEVVMPYEESPNHLARHVERRLFSPTFDMDDATFVRDVQPVIDALRALPDPDRPRAREGRHQLTVLRPTA
jgi:ubiquinone/menaquinone biosynthesis C-methylase UbiE